jgi:integrase
MPNLDSPSLPSAKPVKLTKPLSDTAVRTATAARNLGKHPDGKGLYLHIFPNGSKYWRLKYRFAGKENILALGVYPEVSLKSARDRRDEARKLLANGIDPNANRKAAKSASANAAGNSFEVIAREWHRKKTSSWSEGHSQRVLSRLERDAFPWIGKRPITDIKTAELLAAMRRIEDRGANDAAHRTLGICRDVFQYAIATGRAERNVAADLTGALAPVERKHFAAITEPVEAGKLLRDIDGIQDTSLIVKSALRLAPLFFQRPGEVARMKWAEVNLDKFEWRYHVSKTKTDHLVPLSRQAVAILRELHSLTGRGEFAFSNQRTPNGSKPMAAESIRKAIRRLGYGNDEMTTHGFRAMARTLLAEELHERPDIIEHQLAHVVSDSLGTAYNRTKFIEQRKQLMQKWADYLDHLKENLK